MVEDSKEKVKDLKKTLTKDLKDLKKSLEQKLAVVAKSRPA